MRFTELMDGIAERRMFEEVNTELLQNIRAEFKHTLGNDISDVLVNYADDGTLSVKLVFETDKQKVWFWLKWS